MNTFPYRNRPPIFNLFQSFPGDMNVTVEGAGELIEPIPVLGDRLEDNRDAEPVDPNFFRVESKLLGKPHGLGTA